MKVRGFWHHKRRWQLVTRLMARDGQDCTICAGPLSRSVRDFNHDDYITFDHIVPRSHGGTDVLANLRLAHQSCNLARGNDPVADEEDIAA